MLFLAPGWHPTGTAVYDPPKKSTKGCWLLQRNAFAVHCLQLVVFHQASFHLSPECLSENILNPLNLL
jgi:hypothetical protein